MTQESQRNTDRQRRRLAEALEEDAGTFDQDGKGTTCIQRRN